MVYSIMRHALSSTAAVYLHYENLGWKQKHNGVEGETCLVCTKSLKSYLADFSLHNLHVLVMSYLNFVLTMIQLCIDKKYFDREKECTAHD